LELVSVLRSIVALAALVLLIGCDQLSSEHSDDHRAQWEAYERAKARDTRALSLFPEAAEVRLFVNEDVISFDENGEPSEGTFPEEGIVLTSAEVEKLRAAVRDVPAPPEVAACCVPRHAFVFFDAQGVRLGALDVCFECICANLWDGARLSERRNVRWIEWDEPTIAEIVRAHGQRTVFEEL
jgi:hypothetical protein